jgi:hypothetical protein
VLPPAAALHKRLHHIYFHEFRLLLFSQKCDAAALKPRFELSHYLAADAHAANDRESDSADELASSSGTSAWDSDEIEEIDAHIEEIEPPDAQLPPHPAATSSAATAAVLAATGTPLPQAGVDAHSIAAGSGAGDDLIISGGQSFACTSTSFSAAVSVQGWVRRIACLASEAASQRCLRGQIVLCAVRDGPTEVRLLWHCLSPTGQSRRRRRLTASVSAVLAARASGAAQTCPRAVTCTPETHSHRA